MGKARRVVKSGMADGRDPHFVLAWLSLSMSGAFFDPRTGLLERASRKEESKAG